MCEDVGLGRLIIKTAMRTVKHTMRMKYKIIGYVKIESISYSQNKLSSVFH